MRRSGGGTFHRRWLRQRHEETLLDALRADSAADIGSSVAERLLALEHAVPITLRAQLDALVGRVLRQRRSLRRIDEQVYAAGTLWRVEARHADRLACIREGDREHVLVLFRPEMLGAAFGG